MSQKNARKGNKYKRPEAFTDGEIGRGDGRTEFEERDQRLVRWSGGNKGTRKGDDETLEWDDSQQNGTWDQFKVNEEKFGVKTSFDMDEYTTKLDKNTDFYKKNKAAADRIARQMLGKQTDNSHVAEERGQKPEVDLDEEAKYSGVLQAGKSAYVAPHRRDASKPLVVVSTEPQQQQQQQVAKTEARKPLRKPLSLGKSFNPNATAFTPKFNMNKLAGASAQQQARAAPQQVAPMVAPQNPIQVLSSNILSVMLREDARAVPVVWPGVAPGAAHPSYQQQQQHQQQQPVYTASNPTLLPYSSPPNARFVPSGVN